MPTFLRSAALLPAVLLAIACSSPAPTPAPTPTPVVSPTPTAATPSPPPTPSPSLAPSPTPTAQASPSPTATPSAAPTASAPPGASAGTLTIWADSVRAPVLSGLAIAFTDTTGTPVRVEAMPFDDIVGQVATLAPAGAGPDIFIGAHDRLGELVPTGVVEPLDLGDKDQSFRPVAIDAFGYDGQLYGLPYLMQGVALTYNKALLAGGIPPASWSELKTMAVEFQAGDPSRQGYCLQQGDAYHSYPLLTGFGGYVFGTASDGWYDSADVGLDSPGGLASAEELDSMVKAGVVRANLDYATCLTLMTTGKALFWISGPWSLPDFTASGIDFGVAPIPTMQGQPRPFVGAQGLMVSNFAVNREAALSFLDDYVATTDVMQQLWEVDPRLPVWNDTLTDANTAAFVASVDSGDPIPSIPEMAAAWPPWAAALNNIFLQRQEPADAFRDAAATIRNLTGQ